MMQHSITIPTKHYIKDYLLHLEKQGELGTVSDIMNMVLLNTNRDFFRRHTRNTKWETTITLQVSDRARISLFDQQLMDEKAIFFNQFMAKHIRTLIFEKMKVYMTFDKNIKRAIEYSREQLGIDFEHYSNDTIAKYYQRNRERLSLPNVYKKTYLKPCS